MPGSAPVNIVGPLPLPVTGSSTVSGTVSVTNPADTPLSVRDVDNPARQQPFRFAGFSLTVPEGKTYVVEQYSARCSELDATGTLTEVSVSVVYDGVTLTDYAVPRYIDANGFRNSIPVNIWAGSGNTRLYAPAGAVIRVNPRHNNNATGARLNACQAQASGYAIDVP